MSTLDITVERDGASAVITLVGRLDTNTAPEFETIAKDTIADGVTDVVVDMSQCTYVSSAGLRVIIVLQKSLLGTGSVVFKGVLPEVKEVFDLTGFSSILKLED